MQPRIGRISSNEVGTVFSVGAETVVGIYHDDAQDGTTGIVFIVGGRQYRTGAHRQFVRLARTLAAEGYPVFRFDLRGMGDSASEPRHFLETGPDIAAAIDEFRRLAPRLERIVLWGLCDGASAGILHAVESAEVYSVMMVNPWISTDGGVARATLTHYYKKRVVSRGFWRKLLTGQVDLVRSLSSLRTTIVRRFGSCLKKKGSAPDLPDIVFNAIAEYRGDVNVVISKKDLTAREFKDEYDRRIVEKDGEALSSKMVSVDADHTFSTPAQHRQLEQLTLDWCQQVRDAT